MVRVPPPHSTPLDAPAQVGRNATSSALAVVVKAEEALGGLHRAVVVCGFE